ncbi:MAG TPA: cation acetate symporter, partial [Burkholderiaceae bacterium]
MANKRYSVKLGRYYGWFTAGFIFFLLVLTLLEREGFPRVWIGYLFLFATILLYAWIGVISRTSDVSEYYV